MARVVLTPEALEDLAQMGTWLEERAPGSGERFARAVEERLALLATHPELGPGYRRRWRRLLIPGFHQGAFYRMRGEIVEVLAIVDLRRDPRDIARTLTDRP